LFAGIGGVSPTNVLRYVASGPFGNGAFRGSGWPAVGLLVHFGIMAAMTAAYMVVARRVPALLRHPVSAGLAYGVLLWLFMYWLVKPLRWPDAPLPHTLYDVANALFSHCVLVGMPIALMARRSFGAEAP
jgi:uncharacterized membrane protein YagU involved in acid resistance